MYQLKLSQYPGGEVRSSVVRIPQSRGENRPLVNGAQNGTIDPEPLSDIKNPTRTGSDEGVKAPKKRPPPKFTLVGKRKLKRAVAAMEDVCPKSQIRFATATFPVWTLDAQEALASQTSYFNDCIQSWLRKRSPEIAWAYCWEFQKRGALHCHWVLSCSNPGVSLPSTLEWAQEVGRLITSMSFRSGVNLWKGKGGVDWSKQRSKLRADCQEIRKSVSGYLAKYLSKAKTPSGNVFYPKRWWGASGLTRQWVATLTTETVLSSGSLRRVSRDSESLLGDLESLCENRFRYRHLYSLGYTDVMYFSDRSVVSQILESKWMKTKKALPGTNSALGGLRACLSVLVQNQLTLDYCLKNASKPLRTAMNSYICAGTSLKGWDWAAIQELRSLVLLSPLAHQAKGVLSRLLLRTLKYEIDNPNPIPLPVLRESEPLHVPDGSPTRVSDPTRRPRPEQKSLFGL